MKTIKILGMKSDYWEDRAEKVLSHFNYQEPHEIDLYEICRKYGIKINPLIDREAKGYSIPKKKGRCGVIYIDERLSEVEKRIVLAEEYCHVYAQCCSQLKSGMIVLNKIENQARRMAAYLLIPHKFLRNFIFRRIYDDDSYILSEIADHFFVTEQLAKYRLELWSNRRGNKFANSNTNRFPVNKCDFIAEEAENYNF